MNTLARRRPDAEHNNGAPGRPRRHVTDVRNGGSGEFSPAQLVVCTTCGARSDRVEFDLPAATQRTETRLHVEVIARCSKCAAILDIVTVVTMFSGKGNWSVAKSHVA